MVKLTIILRKRTAPKVVNLPNGRSFTFFTRFYRLDRNSNGGGILLCVREDIPSTLLNTELLIDGFCIEINIRKKKWLLVCTNNPNKNLISSHLKEIGKNLDNYSSKYDNFILLGDLNSEPTESAVRDFCWIYGCKKLIKDNTCFKNPEKPACIDLIITNRPKSFQNSMTLEIGLSDFHKMTFTVMKVFYKKKQPTIIHTAAIKIFLMRFLWLIFRIQYLK